MAHALPLPVVGIAPIVAAAGGSSSVRDNSRANLIFSIEIEVREVSGQNNLLSYPEGPQQGRRKNETHRLPNRNHPRPRTGFAT